MPQDHVTDLPMQVRAASFAPATLDQQARTIELVWSTGARVRRFDYWRERFYDEELVLAANAVDLTRLNGGANLLDSHGARRLQGILGVVERAWLAIGVDGQPEGRATVRFSDREEVASVWRDVQNGIIRNVSVGYQVRRFEMVERQGEVPLYRAIEWQPGEISLVAVGADPGAGTRSAPEAPRNPCAFVHHIPETEMSRETPAGGAPAATPPATPPNPAADPTRTAGTPAPPATPPAAAPPGNVVDLDSARAQGRADALAYVAEVNDLCGLAGLAERAAEFIAAGTPPAAVRKALLESRAADSAARGIVGVNGGGQAAADKGWGRALTRAGVARKEA